MQVHSALYLSRRTSDFLPEEVQVAMSTSSVPGPQGEHGTLEARSMTRVRFRSWEGTGDEPAAVPTIPLISVEGA